MNDVERETVLHALSDDQIKHYFSDEPRFKGVFANDEKFKLQKGECCILNLENSNQGGSHWVALMDGIYYDSYGVCPTSEIDPFVKKYNHNDYQGLLASSCGYFAIYFICNFLKHRDPAFGLLANKTRYNENILKKFFF